jgi:hypothetical protein
MLLALACNVSLVTRAPKQITRKQKKKKKKKKRRGKEKKKKLYLRLGEIWYKPVLAAPIHKSRPVFVPRALAKVLN